MGWEISGEFGVGASVGHSAIESICEAATFSRGADLGHWKSSHNNGRFPGVTWHLATLILPLAPLPTNIFGILIKHS